MNPWPNLDSQSIRIFDFDLSPRDPDEIVIQEDLDYFVQKTRTINVKPTVTIAGGRVFAVNGVPFILAAQRATPPITSIAYGRNIDLMFAGVDYWQMAHEYTGLSLRLPTKDELAFLRRQTKELAEHRVKVLQANGAERYLVVAAFRWIERNRLPYSENALFD